MVAPRSEVRMPTVPATAHTAERPGLSVPEEGQPEHESAIPPGLLLLPASLSSLPLVSTFSSTNTSPSLATQTASSAFPAHADLSDLFSWLREPTLHNSALHPTSFCTVCCIYRRHMRGRNQYSIQVPPLKIFRKEELPSSNQLLST